MVEVFSTRDMRKNAAVAFASVDKDVNCEGEDVAKLSGHPVLSKQKDTNSSDEKQS